MHLRQRIKIFVISLIATLAIFRIFLFIFPSINLNVGKYNIHHLFVGALLLILVLLLFIFNVFNRFTIISAGFSSALVLDQIVYLVATDGSDKSYLTKVSLFGMVILTSVILILTIILYSLNKQKSIR